MSKFLDNLSVQKVIKVLSDTAHSGQVIELEATARTAEEAASSLGVEVGAIVKTLIFKIKVKDRETPVVALVSGDRRCNTKLLAGLAGIEGKCVRPDADEVKSITGYSIGGVSPAGLPSGLPILLDQYLNRFSTVWSAAGHPHCVFPASFVELKSLTKAKVSDQLSESLVIENSVRQKLL